MPIIYVLMEKKKQLDLFVLIGIQYAFLQLELIYNKTVFAVSVDSKMTLLSSNGSLHSPETVVREQ